MNKFFDELNQLSKQPIVDKGVPFNVGYFDQYMFDTFIHSIEQKSDQEVINFLRTNANYMFEKIINREWEYDKLFWSEKFYRCIERVLNTIPITGIIRMGFNKIGYDHILPSQEKPEKKVMDMYLDIAQMVNQPYVSQLCAKVDLYRKNATSLCICRFSSINEDINIRRLNFYMCGNSQDIMTEQNIVYIYEILFDRITDLFKYSMLEYYPPDQELELGEEFSEIYSTISLAILDIVNNMPMEAIRQVIKNYVQDWEYAKCPPVRFSLMALSADYSRINEVVEELTRNRIYIP